MDPKFREIAARTNLGDLLQPASSDEDVNQPVALAPPPEIEVARSTVDPFHANLATADIAEKLHHSRIGPNLKVCALILLGIPQLISGIGLINMAWSDPTLGPLDSLLSTLVGIAVAAFWPYIIFGNRNRKARAS